MATDHQVGGSSPSGHTKKANDFRSLFYFKPGAGTLKKERRHAHARHLQVHAKRGTITLGTGTLTLGTSTLTLDTGTPTPGTGTPTLGTGTLTPGAALSRQAQHQLQGGRLAK